MDPVGGTRGLNALSRAYQATGHSDMTLNIYPDGRHEMLNEINRDEVTANILDWCDAALVRQKKAPVLRRGLGFSGFAAPSWSG